VADSAMFSLFLTRSVPNGSNTQTGLDSGDEGPYQQTTNLALDPWNLDDELRSFLESSSN